MAIYFSPSRGWFYDTALFGEPFCEVIDPNWKRPVLTVTLAPGEVYWAEGQALATNTTDVAAPFEVADWTATPPTVSVANSACALPADVVGVPDALYQALMAAQSQGKLIQADSTGLPVAVDPPAPTTTQLAAQVRAKRDALISETDYLVMPDYPISADDLAQLKAYREALRNVPGQSGFPASVQWPNLTLASSS